MSAPDISAALFVLGFALFVFIIPNKRDLQ